MSAPQITIGDVLAVVSAHYGAPVPALKSHRRTEALTQARQVAYHLTKRLTERSMTEIARLFGDRDHTTVLHGLRRMEERLAREPGLAEELVALEGVIIATARLRERRMILPPKDVDPHAVAIRVATGGERAAGAVSIDEIKAVCAALADRDHELATLRPRVAAARDAAEALRAQRQAQFTRAERDAKARVERALKCLSTAFEGQDHD